MFNKIHKAMVVHDLTDAEITALTNQDEDHFYVSSDTSTAYYVDTAGIPRAFGGESVIELPASDFRNTDIQPEAIVNHPTVEAAPNGSYVRVAPNMDNITMSAIETIIEDVAPNSHNCFPSIMKMDNGDWLLCYKEASGHLGDDGLPAYIRSTDNGTTWSDPEYIETVPATGTTFGYRSFGLVKGNTKGQVFYFYTESRDILGVRDTLLHYKESSDNGYTWGARVTVPGTPGGIDSMQVSSNGYNSNGRLFMPVYGWNSPTITANEPEAGTLISDDNGATWTYTRFGTAADQSVGDFAEGFITPSLAGLTAMVRVGSTPGQLARFTSDDNGTTWTSQGFSTISNYNGTRADVAYLGNGRMYMVARDGANGNSPSLHYSEDDGATWTKAVTAFDPEDYSYGSWLVISPTELVLIYGAELALGGSDAKVKRINFSRTAGSLFKKVDGKVIPLSTDSSVSFEPIHSDIDITSIGVSIPTNTGCAGVDPNRTANLRFLFSPTVTNAQGAVKYKQTFVYGAGPQENQVALRSTNSSLDTGVYLKQTRSPDFIAIRDHGPNDQMYRVEVSDATGAKQVYSTDVLSYNPCNSDTGPFNINTIKVWQDVNGINRWQTRLRQQTVRINSVPHYMIQIKNTYYGEVLYYKVKVYNPAGEIMVMSTNPDENSWILPGSAAGETWTMNISVETTETQGLISENNFTFNTFV